MENEDAKILSPELEARVVRAVEYFKSGYNCSQSVVAAFADFYDFSEKQALRVAASFGGGIGRMRLTCGAACGLFLLAGLDDSADEGADREGKSRNYALVQQFAERFREINGSITCSELLGLDKKAPISTQAEARTEAYYKKRPCSAMVESAARLFAEYLQAKEENV